MANKMLLLLNNPNLAHIMGKRAKLNIQKNYSLNKQLEQLKSLINNIEN